MTNLETVFQTRAGRTWSTSSLARGSSSHPGSLASATQELSRRVPGCSASSLPGSHWPPIFAYESWEEWVAAAIGVWVFISPWVLGAASDARILWSSLIVGALLVILALWSSSLEHGSGAVTSRR